MFVDFPNSLQTNNSVELIRTSVKFTIASNRKETFEWNALEMVVVWVCS